MLPSLLLLAGPVPGGGSPKTAGFGGAAYKNSDVAVIFDGHCHGFPSYFTAMKPLSASAEQSLLLAVWQEIGRHLELGESLGTIARAVAARVPIDRFRVVSLDPGNGTAVVLDTEGPFTAPCARSVQ